MFTVTLPTTRTLPGLTDTYWTVTLTDGRVTGLSFSDGDVSDMWEEIADRAALLAWLQGSADRQQAIVEATALAVLDRPRADVETITREVATSEYARERWTREREAAREDDYLYA